MSDLPRPFGTYHLLKLLARGGMGEIYLARTMGITGFEKYYAVKKLLKKFTHDHDVGARFVDEAKLGARLQHPNIVQVYDLGKVSDELYMATEFVDGFDLRRVLRFCHEKKKRIPLDIALFIVREILSGLAYAHRQVDAEGHSINLIHRDISPQNVLVSFEGEVKIIDFGLAKSTQRSQETQANVLLGNFGYMSPEQARGQPLDVRTDVYSAGIVMFELVTGTKRFVEENPLKLLEMVAKPTPIMPSDRVPGCPKLIDRIYQRSTNPGKDDRYVSAESFRDDVTTALHRINPKAAREHLAQFLNHLFLGGQPPPPVDADILDKSVALKVSDLYGKSDAFQAPKDGDTSDRRLSGFADDMPQTASHPILRAARAGDVLSHRDLTGEDAPSAPALSVSMASSAVQPLAAVAVPTAAPAASYTAQAPLADPSLTAPESLDDAVVEELEWEPPDVESARPTSVYDSPSWPGELDAAAASGAPPPTREAPVAAPVPESEETEVRAPAPAPTDPPSDVQRQMEADVQAQLDAQAAQLAHAQATQAEAEAEVQRQLEAQAEVQRQLEAQLRGEPRPEQRPEQRLEQQRLEQQRLEQQRLEQQRLEQQRLEQQRLEQLRLEQQRLDQQRLEQQRLEQQRLEQQRLDQLRLEQQRLELQRQEQLKQEQLKQEQLKQEQQRQERLDVPVYRPSGSTGSVKIPLQPQTVASPQAVVTSVVGGRRGSHPASEPSIVLSADLDTSEPTLVGAMPVPDGQRTLEVSPVRSRPPAAFPDDAAADSLIIDLADPSLEADDVVVQGEALSLGDAEHTEPMPRAPTRPFGEVNLPSPVVAEATIRPAAQPLGKRVVPSVALPKKPSSPSRPGASEEGGPATMPPPSRRR